MEEEDARHMTERILDLTLEIISLLTGETFTAVKSGDLVAIMVPPFHFMIPEITDQQRLLELTNKMIELLTGESGLFGSCSISGHEQKPDKNLGAEDQSDGQQKLKGPLMEDQRIGGDRKRDSPERPPPSHHSRDAASEGQEIPHHDQVNDLVVVKVPDSDDEDVACVTEDQQLRPPPDGAGDISTTFPHSHGPAQEVRHHPPQTCPRPHLYSQDSLQDHQGLPHSIQGEDFIVVKVGPKEEEEEAELYVGGGPQATEEVEILLNVKVGEISAGVGPALPPSYIIEDDDTAESFPEDPPLPVKSLAHPATREAGSEKFACRDCGRRLTSKYNLMIHRRVHTGERPFTCSECGRSFTRKENLHHHQKLHADQRAFPCYKCGKSYVTPSGLIRHFRSHAVNGRRVTKEAVAGLPVPPDLEVHILPNSPEPTYEDILNSDSSPTIAAPAAGHGVSDKGQFTCSVCGKGFGSNFNLQVHQRVHTGERPFSCPLCGRTFTRKENLKRHHVTHSGEKPFPCPDCGKHFTQKGSLIKHWRTHAGVANALPANHGSLS